MKKGFTLIELMIVVVIIGILAAIAIPNFVKIIDRAKEASVKSNMHTVQVTTETMSVDAAGAYPIYADFTADDLPGNFQNPYDASAAGTGLNAIKNGSIVDGTAADEGKVGFFSDATATYNGTYYSISGGGKDGKLLDLVLSPGQ